MAVLPPGNTTDLSIVADAAHAVNPWVALAYLAAGVLFILALRGLSSPATSQRGNRFGMAGMLIAAAAAGNPVAKWLGLVGVALASVNIFGGFAVTARMLAMYKKKER